MQINPIVKKDVKVQARSMRISWGLFAYEAIMAAVFFFALFIIQVENSYTSSNIYSSIVGLYPTLAITQIIILGVVIPIRTASSISGEKERQTFDIMMTTSMTPKSIILGKVTIAIIQGMFFVVGGMPIMALAFVSGGISWIYLLWFFAIAVLVSLFSASIGIFCSSVCKKSISAVIMSYGFYVIFFLGTLIPYVIEIILYTTKSLSGMNIAPWILLLNPAVYLIEFFGWTMGGSSYMYLMLQYGLSLSYTQKEMHYLWMTLSSVLLILVSFLFLWIAAKRISPISKKKAQKLANGIRQENLNG
jgi:ABC-type transport system involved in multi-copper enzyme maturation permease subunit